MSDTLLDNLQATNPLLSDLIVGVGGDQNFIADQVLPIVAVPSENVTYRKGGNEHLVAEGAINSLRPVGAMPRTTTVNFSTGTVVLDEYMEAADLDYRETQAAQAHPGNALNIKMAKLAAAKSKVLLDKEQAVADVVFNASNYTSRTSSAIDFAATGIRRVILEAKDAVRKLAGYAPNTLVLGPTAEIELRSNADLLSAMGNVGDARQPDLSDIARFLGLSAVLVGSAVKQTAASAGDAGTGSYVWTADSAALIYANRGAASPWNPSFGYLFQMLYPQTNSQELVLEWSNNPIITNMAYGQRFKPVATFVKAGYLWTNVDQ
jgi:hypothetical protein